MKNLKHISKISLIVLISIIGIISLLIGGLNVAKFAIYNDYYSMKTDICKIPGLKQGLVPQGIAIDEEKQKILVSGYMNDNSSSRIYVTDYNNQSHYVNLKQGEEDFTGHVGGLSISGDNVYLANDGKIHTLSLNDILSNQSGTSIDVGFGISTNNASSFVYSDENYLYVGEFHDGKDYITNHLYETNEGTHYAIVSRYNLNDLTKPDKIYSIRNKVQGICFTPDGQVIMSTSYGLKDTIYYVYSEKEATKSEYTLDGADVYYLDHCLKTIHAPAMGEDLDYYDGKVITLFESASKKYFFGKLFGAYEIVSIDFKSK